MIDNAEQWEEYDAIIEEAQGRELCWRIELRARFIQYCSACEFSLSVRETEARSDHGAQAMELDSACSRTLRGSGSTANAQNESLQCLRAGVRGK